MTSDSIIFSFFLIFSGAAALASLALFARQPVLIAYIALGSLLGPYGFSLIDDPQVISDIARVGIIFLLFLIGLELHPRNFVELIKKSSAVVILSTIFFLFIGAAIAILFGFTNQEAGIIGLTLTFSSTIIGIKLLPTTSLHHKHIGELVVGLLLIQDLLAVILISLMGTSFSSENVGRQVLQMLLLVPALVGFAFIFVRYVVLPLLYRFDRFHEYIFLVALGWCLGMAEMSSLLGVSHEIGAFIGGVSLAQSRISQYITSHLKPLRDFFLVLFFFSLGASLEWSLLSNVLLPALIFTAVVIVLKPVIYSFILQKFGETDSLSWEIGIRLGQTSEFSLLVAYLGLSAGWISESTSLLIQLTAILTFIVSSYWVVFRYPTPIAISDRLRRD
ncbi:MAG: cation:proton antiporter [Pseudomonadota bacterium]